MHGTDTSQSFFGIEELGCCFEKYLGFVIASGGRSLAWSEVMLPVLVFSWKYVWKHTVTMWIHSCHMQRWIPIGWLARYQFVRYKMMDPQPWLRYTLSWDLSLFGWLPPSALEHISMARPFARFIDMLTLPTCICYDCSLPTSMLYHS